MTKTKPADKEREAVLERFMKELFPIKELFQVGFFTPDMKGNYEAMAKRVCDFFGYKTVYEYRATETRCHITTGTPKMSVNKSGEIEHEPFITIIPSIYE